MGVVHDVIADAAQEGAPELAHPASPAHDQHRLLFLSYSHNGLPWVSLFRHEFGRFLKNEEDEVAKCSNQYCATLKTTNSVLGISLISLKVTETKSSVIIYGRSTYYLFIVVHAEAFIYKTLFRLVRFVACERYIK